MSAHLDSLNSLNGNQDLEKQLSLINIEFYECQIDNCNDSIHTTFYDFVNHINGHISEIIKFRQNPLSNTSASFDCPWKNCHGICNLRTLPYHIFFHTHSCYLQNKGRKYIFDIRKKFPNQQYQCPNSNPILNKNMISSSFGNQCLWCSSDSGQICSFTHPMCMAFYRHLEEHAREDNFDSNNRNHYHDGYRCFWKGCITKPKSSLHKLIEHIRSHTKERIIACPYCYSEFCNNAGFYNHLIRSNKNPSFTCQLCHKSKSSQRLLDQHLRIHISTTKCPYCEMTLVNKTNLKRHILHKHTELPSKFLCEYCNKLFKSEESLSNHKDYKHFGTGRSYNTGSLNLYSCIKCQFICTKSSGMTKHLKNEHNFRLPNGFSKFQYRKDERGVYQVVCERYEVAQLQ